MVNVGDTVSTARSPLGRHAVRPATGQPSELPRRSGRHRTKEPMVALDELELDDNQLGSIVRRLSSETF
jgi:hypothetical protein